MNDNIRYKIKLRFSKTGHGGGNYTDRESCILNIAEDEYNILQAENKRLDLIEFEKERLKWSLETFEDATPISSLRKLESEIKEIEEDISKGMANPTEYADALMCLLDSAGRQGITLEQIIKAFEYKIEVNKGREWKKNPDNLYSYIESTKH